MLKKILSSNDVIGPEYQACSHAPPESDYVIKYQLKNYDQGWKTEYIQKLRGKEKKPIKHNRTEKAAHRHKHTFILPPQVSEQQRQVTVAG